MHLCRLRSTPLVTAELVCCTAPSCICVYVSRTQLGPCELAIHKRYNLDSRCRAGAHALQMQPLTVALRLGLRLGRTHCSQMMPCIRFYAGGVGSLPQVLRTMLTGTLYDSRICDCHAQPNCNTSRSDNSSMGWRIGRFAALRVVGGITHAWELASHIRRVWGYWGDSLRQTARVVCLR